MNLQNLTLPQLKSLKRDLDKHFYSVGTNIALLSALRKKQVTEFQRKMTQAIKSQIESVAQLGHVGSLRKNDFWLSLADAFPGGRTGLLAFLLMAGQEGGQAALDKMLPNHVFTLEDSVIKDMLSDRVEFLIGSVDETGQAWISQILDMADKKGLSDTEVVKLLRSEAARVALQRSEVITETELTTAMNLVESETYRRNGIETVIWKTSADERVCLEVCMANENIGKIALGETFPSGQTEPPGHIRCRCYLLPVLPTQIEGEVWTGK
jgi:SPP1 gp7 family putative phage head morphogenesis protein